MRDLPGASLAPQGGELTTKRAGELMKGDNVVDPNGEVGEVAYTITDRGYVIVVYHLYAQPGDVFPRVTRSFRIFRDAEVEVRP